eukprot:2298703-Rhodomonas_salina.1
MPPCSAKHAPFPCALSEDMRRLGGVDDTWGVTWGGQSRAPLRSTSRVSSLILAPATTRAPHSLSPLNLP